MSRRSKREVAPQPLQAGLDASSWGPDTASAAAGDAVSAAAGNAAFLAAGNGASAAAAGQAGAWWPGTLPQIASFGAVATDCGMDLRPPGGFLSYFQTGHQPFILPHVSFPAPWPSTINESVSAPNNDLGTDRAAPRRKSKVVIHIDDGNDIRTARRLVWEQDEDLRLVSAWLYHSNDPVNGNCKKNESYWSDVLELYNKSTPVNRKREIKHLKDRWVRIKRWVAFFCASWKKATSIYTSGYSDDQHRDMAHKFYVDDFPKEGPFTVEHCWKVLRDEPKWLAVLEEQEKPNKRSLDDGEFILQNIGEKERPIGTKEAKKQRNGKGKSKDDDASLQEDMKKYMDIQAAASKRHEEFIEAQQRVSDSKLETARLRREAILLESYQKLMSMDTREMTDEMKAEHTAGLKILRDSSSSSIFCQWDAIRHRILSC